MKHRLVHLVRSQERDYVLEEVEDEKGRMKTVKTPVTVERLYGCNSHEDALDFIREDKGRDRFYDLRYAGTRIQKI